MERFYRVAPNSTSSDEALATARAILKECENASETNKEIARLHAAALVSGSATHRFIETVSLERFARVCGGK